MKLLPFEMKTSRLKFAGLKNSFESGIPVIALHGWLDNAASFIPLAKYLNSNRPFWAIDLPGHGLSDHRSVDTSYHLLEYIVDIRSFVDALIAKNSDVQKVILLGHSLGGIVASLFASACPDRVEKLVLLDSLGPLTDKTEDVLPQLRKAVEKASKSQSKVTVYPNFDLAVKARMQSAVKVSQSAAELLVRRGGREVENGFTWRSDPKLLHPSLLRLNEEQVEALFNGVECPVKLIIGNQGYFSAYEQLKKRLTYFKDIQCVNVGGGHHFHMDGDVKKTAELINAYLSD